MAHKPFQRKDRFYFKAKKEGYPARSAYKIIELNARFKIFKSGNTVVDLGCAPGGWFKVAQENMKRGTLIGIDLLPLKVSLKQNSHFIQGDFTSLENQNQILAKLNSGADWVISDMSPNISGIKFKDEFESYELSQQAMQFAKNILKPKGSFLCKIFPGFEIEGFRKELKKYFKKIVTVVPEATRQSSSEIYFVALELKS